MARFLESKEALTFNDVLLVPQYSEISSREDINISTLFSKKITLSCPVVSANMDTVTESDMAIAMARLGGLGIIHRYLDIEHQTLEVENVKKSGLVVGAAIGIKNDYLERAKALVYAGVDVLVLDVAHGHSKAALKAIDAVKKAFPATDLVAGNVATSKGVVDLISAGVDGIKVGVGPGCACTTRIVAGAGIPQLTALIDCYEAAKGLVPICADGGIKEPGDAAKALATGASTIMIGGLLAGTDESSGEFIVKDGRPYKTYRGMASYSASKRNNQNLRKNYVPEGVESVVPYVGKVADVLNRIVGGIRSGMSYSGAANLREFPRKALFVKITQNGWNESLSRI